LDTGRTGSSQEGVMRAPEKIVMEYGCGVGAILFLIAIVVPIAHFWWGVLAEWVR